MFREFDIPIALGAVALVATVAALFHVALESGAW